MDANGVLMLWQAGTQKANERSENMYFKLIYGEESRLYHARLYNARKQLLFWTKEYATKDAVVAVCGEVKQNMNAEVPIYDV
jgi:hypothetical protein